MLGNTVESEDDFGLDSLDDAALEEVAVAIESPSLKRKIRDEFDISSSDDAVIESAAVAVESPGAQSKKRKIESSQISSQFKRARTYPLTSSIAVTTLTSRFNLPSFRLQQEAVISCILAGGSAAVVFPTGGGKSLCYQVPAIAFYEVDRSSKANGRKEGEGGITLVVSPLIALMKDQVDALRRRGIKAAVLDSTKTREEYLETTDAMRRGDLKLLYCAPERLNNEGFVEQMKGVRGGIRLVAVDEAHCISEWGHAFRPDYLKVSRFVKEVKAERVVCLTATATPQVAKDICDAFDIDDSGLFRTSSYRANLRLLAESGPTKMSLYPKLFTFLQANPGPTIVYVTLQKQTELLSADLRRQGFNAKSFHAGMQSAEKMNIQDRFMASDDQIIVATIAFGMGIDKANIRNVIHFNIPSSLESYSQEIGRAGRDGNSSNCLFYLCGEDLHLRELFARGDLPNPNSVRRLLTELVKSAPTSLKVGETIQVSHFDQSRTFDIRSTTLSNIYAQLELRFGLLRATTPVYTKYSYKEGPYFHMVHSDHSPAATAIKSSAHKAKTLTTVDVGSISLSSRILRADLIRKLNEWNDAQAIDLRTAGVLNVYRITAPWPSTTSAIDTLANDLFAQLASREQKDLQRTDEMLALITGTACFSRTLANHFGDDLPDGANECGHCTWCIEHTAVELKTPPPKKFDEDAFERVLKDVPVRDDARFLARVAFGISSPRTTAMKLGNSPVFGSMGDCEFMELLRRFEKVCGSEGEKSGR